MIDWQDEVCRLAELVLKVNKGHRLTTEKHTALRPKSIKGVGDKDADAENYKKCHQSFKHGLSTQ